MTPRVVYSVCAVQAAPGERARAHKVADAYIAARGQGQVGNKRAGVLSPIVHPKLGQYMVSATAFVRNVDIKTSHHSCCGLPGW